MRFGELTFPEIHERADAGWLAVAPVGCLQQQGHHLPVDFDPWLAEAVTLAGAERAARDFEIHALVLPVIPFGPVAEHRNFGSGYIHLPAKLHSAVLYAVLRSLVEQGFRRLVIWQGRGGHHLGDVVSQFNAEHAGRARAFLPALPYEEIWCQHGDPDIPGGHADSFATSLALYLRPDAVRTHHIITPRCKPVNWADPELDLSRHTNTGVIGDPTHATAELGQRLWEATVEAVALILKDAAQASV